MIDRMGLAGSATGQAMQRLPPAVTLAFVPVIDRQEGWVEAARARGHEIILSVPMEPLTYPHDDPGPNTLLLSLDAAHNIDRLNWALGRFAGYIGITSPTGSRFSGDSSAMRPIMDSLKKRGLAFLDVHATRGSVGDPLAVELSVPHARVDRIIDQDPSRGGIDSELSALESIALKNGVAIGLGEPYPTTIERISQWIPLLADKKLMLVPLSATINLQKPQEPTVTHAPEHGPDHASGHAPEHH
ncbi:MAG: divergent polysaccharide deacetylase family protein [Rhodospirillaceae bacterium]